LQIYDGLQADAPELDKICGQNLTDHVYTSTGNSIRVRMVGGDNF